MHKITKVFLMLFSMLVFLPVHSMETAEPIDVSEGLRTAITKLTSIVSLTARLKDQRNVCLFYEQQDWSASINFFLNNAQGKDFFYKVIRFVAAGNKNAIVELVHQRKVVDMESYSFSMRWKDGFSDDQILARAELVCTEFQSDAQKFVALEKLQQAYLKYQEEKAALAAAVPAAPIIPSPANLTTSTPTMTQPALIDESIVVAQSPSPTLPAADVVQSPSMPHASPSQPDTGLRKIQSPGLDPLTPSPSATTVSPSTAEQSSPAIAPKPQPSGGSRGDDNFKIHSNVHKDLPWHKKWQNIAAIAGGSLIVASIIAFITISLIKKTGEEHDLEQAAV